VDAGGTSAMVMVSSFYSSIPPRDSPIHHGLHLLKPAYSFLRIPVGQTARRRSRQRRFHGGGIGFRFSHRLPVRLSILNHLTVKQRSGRAKWIPQARKKQRPQVLLIPGLAALFSSEGDGNRTRNHRIDRSHAKPAQMPVFPEDFNDSRPFGGICKPS